ncbi:MAG: GNAT family N-acetyltransferase [Acutalibacteraceae bacterium]
MTVRQAEMNDFEIIEDYSKQAADLHIQNRPDIFRSAPILSKADFKKLLKDKNIFIFVAETDGKPVGCCKLRLVSSGGDALTPRTVAFIDEFFVDEKHRRQGVGTTLFNEVKAFALSKGARSVELYVWSFNEPAQKLYESLGMKPQRTVMELKL